MNLKLRLVMTFKTAAGDKVSLTLDDPRTDVTEQEIKTAMELIITQNIFSPKGSELKEVVEARVVKTDTTEYDLIIG